MKYKLLVITIFTILCFNLISCSFSKVNKKNDNLTDQKEDINKVDSNILENDNVFLALRGNGGSSGFDLLAKFNDSKTFEEVDIGPDPFSITYSDRLNRIFFVDENGTIRTKGENDKNNYGLNSTGSYREGAGYKMWNLGVAYKMSKDKTSLVYTNNDRELIFVNSHGNQTIIAEEVGFINEYSNKCVNERFFEISDDGKYVIFNSDYGLSSYNVETMESLKLDREVENFEISKSGENVVYTLKEQDGLLVRNLKKNTTKKYNEFSSGQIWDMKIFDDGSVILISDIEEDMMMGFVTYIDKQGVVYKIPSKVICYELFKSIEYVQIVDGIAYYIDGNFKLSSYKLGSDIVNIVADNVNDFEVIENDLYYMLNNGEFYKLDNMKDKELLIQKSENLDNQAYIEKLDDKNVLIKTANNEIYINEKYIASGVEGVDFYVDTLAYCTNNDELYTVNLKSKKNKLEFKGYKSFDCIYYGNNMIYKSDMLMGM